METRCSKTRLESIDLLKRLRTREIGKPTKANRRPKPDTRRFYDILVPNYCVEDVTMPSCYIKKFSIDGKFLVCFSKTLHGLLLFRFIGFPDLGRPTEKRLERRFESYFSLVYESTLVSGAEHLCKDFCLTTTCGNYLILASSMSAIPPTPPLLHPPPQQQHNDCLQLSHKEHYTFFVVGLRDGVVYDKRDFKNDHIQLAHHAGVHLCEDLFAVLSLETQTVFVFRITSTGALVEIRKIGRSYFDNDEQLIASNVHHYHALQYPSSTSPVTATSPSAPLPPCTTPSVPSPSSFHSFSATTTTIATSTSTPSTLSTSSDGPTAMLGGLRQRVLSFLYRRAATADSTGPSTSTTHRPRGLFAHLAALRYFYLIFAAICSLAISRMQLLDRDHLLLRLANSDAVAAAATGLHHHRTAAADRTAPPWSSAAVNTPAVFVVFNLATDTVEAVFDDTDPDAARAVEQFIGHIRNVGDHNPGAECAYARENFRQQLAAVVDPTRRLLALLPLAPQMTSPSPYFDQSLFVYNVRRISATERPRPCGVAAGYGHGDIRFYSRESGQLRFCIGSMPATDEPAEAESTSSTPVPVSAAAQPPTRPHGRAGPGGPTMGASAKGPHDEWEAYHFHPLLPFVLAVRYSLAMPPVLNIFLRRF